MQLVQRRSWAVAMGKRLRTMLRHILDGLRLRPWIWWLKDCDCVARVRFECETEADIVVVGICFVSK